MPSALTRGALQAIFWLKPLPWPTKVVATRAQAEAWLSELGDPYTRTGSDMDGRVGIEWGVYGVPETFIVNGDGKIVYKHVGPLSRRDLNEKIRPIIQSLRSRSRTGDSQ